MFSFIKKYASGIDGVAIYPDISLIIFFGFFLLLIISLWKMNKNYIKELEEIPLKD